MRATSAKSDTAVAGVFVESVKTSGLKYTAEIQQYDTRRPTVRAGDSRIGGGMLRHGMVSPLRMKPMKNGKWEHNMKDSTINDCDVCGNDDYDIERDGITETYYCSECGSRVAEQVMGPSD